MDNLPTTDDETISLIAKKHEFVIEKTIRRTAKSFFFLDAEIFLVSSRHKSAAGGSVGRIGSVLNDFLQKLHPVAMSLRWNDYI